MVILDKNIRTGQRSTARLAGRIAETECTGTGSTIITDLALPAGSRLRIETPLGGLMQRPRKFQFWAVFPVDRRARSTRP